MRMFALAALLALPVCGQASYQVSFGIRGGGGKCLYPVIPQTLSLPGQRQHVVLAIDLKKSCDPAAFYSPVFKFPQVWMILTIKQSLQPMTLAGWDGAFMLDGSAGSFLLGHQTEAIGVAPPRGLPTPFTFHFQAIARKWNGSVHLDNAWIIQVL